MGNHGREVDPGSHQLCNEKIPEECWMQALWVLRVSKMHSHVNLMEFIIFVFYLQMKTPSAFQRTPARNSHTHMQTLKAILKAKYEDWVVLDLLIE